MLLLPYIGLNTAPVSGQVTLNSNMGLDASYYAYRQTTTSGASCTATLTINGDGTWSVSKTAQATWQQGSTFTGNWGTPTTPGVGSDYEVSFNNGSSYTTIGAGQSASAFSNDVSFNDGGEVDTISSTVIVRKIGTTSPTSSDTYSISAEDDFSSA